MKKKILLLFAICSISYTMHAATVRIKNESSHPIWVRINNRTRNGVTHFWHNNFKKRVMSTKLAAMLLAPSLGINAITIKKNLDEMKKEFYRKVPDFERINPGDSNFFNTGFNKISKVTFLRPIDNKITLPKKRIIPEVNKVGNELGNIYAYKADRKAGAQSTPVIVIEDEYGEPEIIPNKPETENENVTINFPSFRSFTIQPDIGALTTEARIVYRGWQDAFRK